MAQTETAPHKNDVQLPRELKRRLWRRIDRRLQKGEILITTDHFQEVMEKEFRRLVHLPPPRKIKELIREMIVAVNQAHPETYLSLGIKNAVTTFFRDVENRLQGESLDAQAEALKMIKQMVQGGRTAFFLESIGVEIGPNGVSRRVEQAILKIVDGRKLVPEVTPQVERKRRRGRGVEWVPVRTTVQEAAPEESEEDGPAQAPLPTAEEEQERVLQEQGREAEIAEKEMEKAPRNLESYLKRKLITEEEALSLRELYSVNERLKKGEIDPEEAERIRNNMDAAVREKVEQQLRQAVDYSVLYLNVFEALQRIPETRDEALRFMIRHKRLIAAADPEVELSPATSQLEEDPELFKSLIEIMERRDHEVRMIVANMPPYRRISGDSENIGNLVIEEGFVDDLRNLSQDELSERLNAPESEVRVRAAADIRCLLVLIRQLVDETPFHQELRRLKIMQTIARIYGDESDPKVGRHRVQHFLKRRLPKQYPTMPSAERSAIEEESKEVMERIDQGEGGEEEAPDKSVRIYRV